MLQRNKKMHINKTEGIEICNIKCRISFAVEVDKAITTSTTEMEETLATLSEVDQHALHDNYFQAKDLLLTSRLKETIRHYDSNTQILYYRTVAHLGLCAFRIANITEAHNSLADLMKNGKLKDLLAPDLLLERPPMPIPVELIECVYLVSAMLLEIPCLAAHEFDTHQRKISKLLYQQLKLSERHSFMGPPDSMREHVVAAAKAMRDGRWAACNGFIINEKMNKKVWNLFSNPDVVRAMLTRLIKEATLRVYLFTFSYIYDSLSISMLGEMFELEISIVHSIISKMIINEGLMVSVDGPSQTVTVHQKPSHLQILASQLTDKIDNLLACKERDMKTIQRNTNSKTFRRKQKK